MNKLSTRVLTAALAVGVIGSAAAQEYGYPRYDDGRGYASGGAYDYARVVSATPILVQVNGPRETTERCYDRPVSGDYYANGDGYRGSNGARTASAVVGGIAGALLGSRVGGGDGRFVGTAVGTMLGSLAGRSIYDTNARSYGGYGNGGGVVSECTPVSYRTERYDRVDGYDVTYEYAGRYYHTRTASPPGDRIRVRVDVLPD